MTTFHSQRLRWGEGNLSVLAHDNPLTMRGLKWGQRLCYFGTMINWCGGIFKLPIYLTPLLMLFTGVPPVTRVHTGRWRSSWSPTCSCASSASSYASNGYGSVWYSELFTMASFWTQVRGTMRRHVLAQVPEIHRDEEARPAGQEHLAVCPTSD